MMKKTIFTLAFAALCLASCHDYRDDYMVADSVYLRSADETLVAEYTVYDRINRIGVIKAGKGLTSCSVELEVDNSLVGDYNYDHGTSYVPLPRSLYNVDEINGKKITFGKDDARVMVDVVWDPAAMVAEYSTSSDDYVIPIRIKDASIDIQEAKRLLLVRPVMATLAPRAARNPVTCKEDSRAAVKLGLVLSSAISVKDVDVTLAFTPKALTYGGKDYVAAPDGSVTLRKSVVTISAGVSEMDFVVDLDMAGVTSDYLGGTISITGVQVRKSSDPDKARPDDSDTEVFDFLPVTSSSMDILVTRTKKL